MIAVTLYAPDFFMQETASSSSMMPSLMFLFSNDFRMKTRCPRTCSKISMLISPSANLVVRCLPRVVSRCETTSFPRISASKANIFRSENYDG